MGACAPIKYATYHHDHNFVAAGRRTLHCQSVAAAAKQLVSRELLQCKHQKKKKLPRRL